MNTNISHTSAAAAAAIRAAKPRFIQCETSTVATCAATRPAAAAVIVARRCCAVRPLTKQTNTTTAASNINTAKTGAGASRTAAAAAAARTSRRYTSVFLSLAACPGITTCATATARPMNTARGYTATAISAVSSTAT